jgi:toxin-antitoxin system PIN domain toxin
MIIPDLNLLIYAYNDGTRLHQEAKSWWENLLDGNTRIGIPWLVSTGFIRLMTHSKVLAHPVSTADAIQFIRQWFALSQVSPVNPGTKHLECMAQCLDAAGTGGSLATDAHIAALAMEYQAEVHSNDTDFSRFSGVKWVNPLK